MNTRARASTLLGLGRAAVYVLLILPGYLLIAQGRYVEGFSWFGPGGYAWIAVALLVIFAKRCRRLPYIGSPRSWIGMACEYVGMMSVAPMVIAVRIANRPIVPCIATARKCLLAALALHRGVAERKKQLSGETRIALARLHFDVGMFSWFLAGTRRQREGPASETGANLRDDATAHVRLAALYCALATEVADPEPTTAAAHHLLALMYVARDRKEAALASLADAVEARWLSTPAAQHVRGRYELMLMSLLPELREARVAQQDTRHQTLVTMLEEGTTAEELAEVRSQIHPEPGQVPISEEEREERRWAEALAETTDQKDCTPKPSHST